MAPQKHSLHGSPPSDWPACLVEEEIVTDTKAGRRGKLPVSHTSWWRGIQAGYYPPPFKLGRRNAWRGADIWRLANEGTEPARKAAKRNKQHDPRQVEMFEISGGGSSDAG